MKLILITLFALGVGSKAQVVISSMEDLEHDSAHEKQLGLLSSGGSNPVLDNHGLHDQDEEIHPTTCLLCCKNKSPKFSGSLCRNPKICFSSRCIKYMAKPRHAHRMHTSGAAEGRSVRMGEQLIPKEQSLHYCRHLYPMFSDVVMQAVSNDACAFTCLSSRSPTLPRHKTPNGWACNGSPDKLCWDGTCLSRAGPKEDFFCREHFSNGSVSKDIIKALVVLPCQIACQTSVTGTVSYLPRHDNEACKPPDWLPFESRL